MPTAELLVGLPAGKISDGVTTPSRATYDGAQLAQALHGDYMYAALRKNLFVAHTQAGVTSSVGLATTYTGLVVSNAIGNPVNLAILRVSVAQSVINAAVNAIGYGFGYSPTTAVVHTTPVTPRNCFVNGPAPYALADTAATLSAAGGFGPVYAEMISDTPTATTNPAAYQAEIRGSIIIPPGGYFLMLAIAASPASALWESILWEEIPL